jgi:hypothetical protein
MKFRFYFVVVLILICFQINAQPYLLSGRVTDAESGQPLAFVSVTIVGNNRSVTTDIDGTFRITSSTPAPTLRFNMVGYESFSVLTDSLKMPLQLSMKKNQIELPEIKVKPGENPAHRIIRRVVENRKMNNPEMLRSFSYTAYCKMSFNYHEDTVISRYRFPFGLDTLLRDTTDLSIRNQTARRHLFLSEYVSQRVYERPGKNNERIISSRVSGLSDPSFAMLASQMQSFSFYNDFVTLLGKQYLNPISFNSHKRYAFHLVDTLYTEKGDSVYVISYHPRKEGAMFNGLKGILYINTDGYAVQNVLAEQVNDDSRYVMRIQQQYQKTDSQNWFPVQLNTDLLFKKMQRKSSFHTYYVLGQGRTYLSDIKINPDVDQVKFTKIALEADKDAALRNDVFWLTHRTVPLSRRDSLTYHIVDSMGRAQRYNQKMKELESLLMGYIPIGPIDLIFKKMVKYNEFEGLKTGVNLTTNQKFSQYFLLGGFASYGFNDKGWKYGANAQVFTSWTSPNRLSVSFRDDVGERGAISFYDDRVATSTARFRNLLVIRMDEIKEREFAIGVGSLGYMRANLYLNQSEKNLYAYSFQTAPGNSSSYFTFTEAGLCIKFGYREQYIKTPQGNLISLGTKYPMVWINYRQGLTVLNGQYKYSKYELKISQTLLSRRWGKFQATGVAAMVKGDVPLCNLYNGNGSYRSFTIEAENSFATMGMDEFYSDRFAALYLRQNFGALFGRHPLFAPEVSIATHLGVGNMSNTQQHIARFKTLEKGYYESGILLNKLIGVLGFGVFYRYGPYQQAKQSDNFAWKLTLNLKL